MDAARGTTAPQHKADVPILVCRNTWMETYATVHETPRSSHGYVIAGNTPWEALNFDDSHGNTFNGYVRVGKDAIRKPGRIDLRKLGAAARAKSVQNTLVVFAATHPDLGGARIVGFYYDAEVFAEAQFIDDPRLGQNAFDGRRIVRMTAQKAILLPVNERSFSLPTKKGGIGQSDLWYGLNKPENSELRAAVLQYSNAVFAESQAGLGSEIIGSETRVSRYASRIERKANNRKFIFEKGFKCEACDFEISLEDNVIWRSAFELHHLNPMSLLDVGDTRPVSASDFAVLCATCHRAIHRTSDPSDILAFRAHRKMLPQKPEAP